MGFLTPDNDPAVLNLPEALGIRREEKEGDSTRKPEILDSADPFENPIIAMINDAHWDDAVTETPKAGYQFPANLVYTGPAVTPGREERPAWKDTVISYPNEMMRPYMVLG